MWEKYFEREIDFFQKVIKEREERDLNTSELKRMLGILKKYDNILKEKRVFPFIDFSNEWLGLKKNE